MKSLLILYCGEYRTFEECLPSHKFLQTTNFDVEVAYCTWNKTITTNHKYGITARSAMLKSNFDNVDETRIRNAFIKNSIELPLHIKINDYNFYAEKKYIRPLLATWKFVIDFVENLEKAYDYIFITRGDLWFSILPSFPEIHNDEIITHPLFYPENPNYTHYNKLHDFYFYGRTDKVIQTLKLYHHKYIIGLEEFGYEEFRKFLTYNWHSWLYDLFPCTRYFKELTNNLDINIKRP